MPPNIDTLLYDLANDPYEIKKRCLCEAHKRQDKEIDDMRTDQTSIYA
jgi:hypothetical protein